MKRKPSKIKVGTILDKDLYASVKAQAAQERKSVSDVMEEALRKYTESLRRPSMSAEAFIRDLCSNPALRLDKKLLREVEDLDEYEE